MYLLLLFHVMVPAIYGQKGLVYYIVVYTVEKLDRVFLML